MTSAPNKTVRSATKGPATARVGQERPAAPTPSTVTVDASRITEMIESIAEIGVDSWGGISRLAFTRAERKAHDLVSSWLTDVGLSIRRDAAGNTVAERPGLDPGAPAIGLGSHLDSVPHGGRFDGTVGVIGAVEVVRLLAENTVQTRHPIRVVVFAGEEGARFGEPCIGSKLAVGMLDERDLTRKCDSGGASLSQAMTGVALDPSRISEARWRPSEWAAFLELHIEQARILEVEGRHIGLVDTVSGSTRLRANFQGRAEHSGGTPMALRADALTAAAEVALAAESLANDPRHHGTRATVGRLDVYPNSITTIPGNVTLTVDVRDIDSDRQRQAAGEIVQQAHHICERRGVGFNVEVIADTSPAVLPMWLRSIMSAACADLGISYRVLTSGAGHDAQIVNSVVPAAMVFVPSRQGLSHVPEEWTSASDIARGIQVLYHSALRLDSFLVNLQASAPNSTSSAAHEERQ